MNQSRAPTRHFLRSSGIMAMLYAGSMVLGLLVGVVLTRTLGARGFGVYSLALTTATLIGLITEFGLPVLAMREAGAARASGNWGPLRGLLGWAGRAIAAISLALIALTYAGVALSGRAADSEYLATMLWAVALVPLVALGKLQSFVLLAFDRVAGGQFAVMILRPLVFILLCLALAKLGGPLSATAAMIAQVGGALAALVMVAWLFRRWRPAELAQAMPERHVREWLSASLPMGMTEGLRLLQGQIALLLTGWLASAAAAGIYRAAEAAMLVTAVVGSVVSTTATPMFARMFGEGDRAGIERIAALSALAMTAGILVLGLPFVIIGAPLFELAFGAEFGASAPVFVLLWGGYVVTCSCGLAQALANMSGHHVLTTQSFVVTASANLLFGFLLIPRFGPVGAGLAMSSSAALGAMWCTWQLWRRTGYNTSVINRNVPGLTLEILRWCLRFRLVRGGDR